MKSNYPRIMFANYLMQNAFISLLLLMSRNFWHPALVESTVNTAIVSLLEKRCFRDEHKYKSHLTIDLNRLEAKGLDLSRFSVN